MPEPLDPHEIDLAALFPTSPAERREELRDLLDAYCEVAYRIFARMERDKPKEVDQQQDSS